jgi:hypothetical protein
MMTDRCPWCRFAEGGCKVADCDFINLKYEKKAIVARMRKEAGKIAEIRKRLLRGNLANEEVIVAAINELMDLGKALEIMGKALQEDFGMSLDEVRKIVKAHRISLVEKARFAALLATARSGKKKRRG